MNAEENKMKDWLHRAYYAEKKAMALEMLVDQCKKRAKEISQNSDNKTSVNDEALRRLKEMQDKFERQKIKCINISDEVSQAISKLNDIDLETVLIHRYLLFHTIEQTAEYINYSPETVKRKQRDAIRKLTPFDLV